MCEQTAFGGALQEVVAMEAIALRLEPLDELIERRCKRAWEEAPCHECRQAAVETFEDSPRLWCSNCRYVFSYTGNTPFAGRTLTPGEIILAFILYADTLLSIHQIPRLLDPFYPTIHSTIRAVEAAFERGFARVWEQFQEEIDGGPRSTKLARSALGTMDSRRRGTACPAPARVNLVAHGGRERRVIL
jgi:hypothetical protein